MYHEEKIIDGILCWRGTPDGEWMQYSKQELTTKVAAYKDLIVGMSFKLAEVKE